MNIARCFTPRRTSRRTSELTRARASDNVKKKTLLEKRAIAPRVQRFVGFAPAMKAKHFAYYDTANEHDAVFGQFFGNPPTSTVAVRVLPPSVKRTFIVGVP